METRRISVDFPRSNEWILTLPIQPHQVFNRIHRQSWCVRSVKWCLGSSEPICQWDMHPKASPSWRTPFAWESHHVHRILRKGGCCIRSLRNMAKFFTSSPILSVTPGWHEKRPPFRLANHGLSQYDRTIYSPDTALLIFREKASFDKLLAEAPLSISIDRKKFDPLSLHWTYLEKEQSPLDLGPRDADRIGDKPWHTSTPFLQILLNPVETEAEKEEREQRQMKKYLEQEAKNRVNVEFKITAAPFAGTQRTYLEYTPYWRAFRIRKSMIQRELEKDVPLHGLSDVEVHKKPQPLPIVNRMREKLSKRMTLRQIHDEYKNQQRDSGKNVKTWVTLYFR